MKIKTVSYEEVFNTGNYTSKRIGVSGELEENETPEEGLTRAKKTVQDFFNSIQNPMVSKTIPPPASIPEVQKEKDVQEELSLADQIRSCTELKVLTSYKFVKKDPEAQAVYDELLKKLSK